MSLSPLLLPGLLLYYVVHRIAVYLRSRKVVADVPWVITYVEPLSVLGASLPTTSWNLGLKFSWNDRLTLYKPAPSKCISVTPILVGEHSIYTANVDAFHQVLGLSSAFEKPDWVIHPMMFLGSNILASEGETWKRQRRIVSPAFNQSTNRNVWETTVSVYRDMCAKERWHEAPSNHVSNVNKITHKLALFIVSMCGFDIPMTWDSPARDHAGHLSLQEMMFEVSSNVLIRSRVPNILYRLGFKKLKLVDEAYTDFENFMQTQIASREIELTAQRELEGDITEGIRNVFGRLVNARLTEGKLALSESEIVGNCFILMFAGHETTANTLAATMALLGLNPDVQERVYESIKLVLGDREPAFEDYDSLDRVLACFYEALRLYPAAYWIIRQAREDTVLSMRRPSSNIVDSMPVAKGQRIVLDVIGLGYDQDYFPDPERFNPERWDKSESMEHFMGFSYGPRTCIGRKFATTEAVAFLTCVLRDWRIEITLEPGETQMQWRERVLNPQFGMALGFNEVPIKLVRRHT